MIFFFFFFCIGDPFEKKVIELKTLDENTVELKVTHCGLCASDMHVLDEDWGPTTYPCSVGHEIAGIVTKVGKNVTHLKVGDRAGAGAQCFSCLQCLPCESGSQNLCQNGPIMTFNGKWPSGERTYGGFADKWRGDHRFIQKIPEGLSNDYAASFFCAGGTVYAPMVRWGVNAESTVGVLGMGGLGHFTVLFAKAMGAKVVCLSRGETKRKDSMAMGCDDFVNIEDAKDLNRMFKTLTHIMCTGYSKNLNWAPYLSALKPNGVFIVTAAHPYDLPTVNPLLLNALQVSIAGSMACSPKELEEMLEFSAKHELKPWITKYEMTNINNAIGDFKNGLARYRFVLEN